MITKTKKNILESYKVGDLISWKSHEGIRESGTGRIIDLWKASSGAYYATVKNSSQTVCISAEDVKTNRDASLRKAEEIKNQINSHYGAELAFIREHQEEYKGKMFYIVHVSGETTYKLQIEDLTIDATAIDYYPPSEVNNGYPWIDSWLENFAKRLGGYWEWDNPASICLAL